MEEKKNGGKELFNRMVKAGQRTYFIAVREAKNANKYLTLTESKAIGDQKFERQSLIVFKDKVNDFIGAVQEACDAVVA